MAEKPPKELTDKQKMFCLEYLVDLNATQAAIRAGYSEKTAAEIGSENLIKPQIQEYIQNELKSRQDRTRITADMVLREYSKIAFSNIQDFTDNTNGVVNINGLDESKGAAISSIETKAVAIGEDANITITKLKLHNKLSALDSIAKHLGMFEKDNAQKQILVAPQIIMGNVANKP